IEPLRGVVVDKASAAYYSGGDKRSITMPHEAERDERSTLRWRHEFAHAIDDFRGTEDDASARYMADVLADAKEVIASTKTRQLRDVFKTPDGVPGGYVVSAFTDFVGALTDNVIG